MTQICHIEAAEEGGQRYNKDSNDDYRRSFENLILLCPNHHVETNNEAVYTVEVLRAMKRKHEKKMLKSSSEQGVFTRNLAALNYVVNKIGATFFTEEGDSDPSTAPDPDKKISYNNVIENKPIIEEYKVYHGKLNKIYEEIEINGSPKKELLLRNIYTLYLKEKGKFSSFEEIKANADSIINKIENELWKIVDRKNEIDSNLPYEAISISLLVIIVDAFMRCKILEEPPKE